MVKSCVCVRAAQPVSGLRRCGALVLLGLLAGCGSAPTRAPGPTPVIHQDAAPVGQFDVSQVPDARPHPVSKVKNKPYTVLGQRYVPLASAEGYRATGIASWYGTKFHGKPTANGEVYNLYAMTAAHKTLPLPSFVRVTNLANGRQVVVRVNDRGPFHDDRIIDLSWAAAKKLGFAANGTARVKLEAVHEPAATAVAAAEVVKPEVAKPVPGKTPRQTPNGPQWLQVAALSSAAGAQALQARLAPLVSQQVVILSDARLHRVRLGPVTSDGELEQLRALLARQQLGPGRLVAVEH